MKTSLFADHMENVSEIGVDQINAGPSSVSFPLALNGSSSFKKIGSSSSYHRGEYEVNKHHESATTTNGHSNKYHANNYREEIPAGVHLHFCHQI